MIALGLLLFLDQVCMGITLIIFLVLQGGTRLLFEVYRGSQTLGKKLPMIKVVNDDLTPLALNLFLIRNLLHGADIFPLFQAAGSLLVWLTYGANQLFYAVALMMVLVFVFLLIVCPRINGEVTPAKH